MNVSSRLKFAVRISRIVTRSPFVAVQVEAKAIGAFGQALLLVLGGFVEDRHEQKQGRKLSTDDGLPELELR